MTKTFSINVGQRGARYIINYIADDCKNQCKNNKFLTYMNFRNIKNNEIIIHIDRSYTYWKYDLSEYGRIKFFREIRVTDYLIFIYIALMIISATIIMKELGISNIIIMIQLLLCVIIILIKILEVTYFPLRILEKFVNEFLL